MGFLRKLFSKKQSTPSDILEVEQATGTGYLGEAEQLANVVAVGLEKENYSGMNRQLAAISQRSAEKETFVFEHPSVIWKFFAVTACLVLSTIFTYFLYIGICTACFSEHLFPVGIAISILSLFVLFFNIILIFKFITSIHYKLRFDKYEELISFKRFAFTEDLALFSDKTEPVVIADLQEAIRLKLIPQGHFSNSKLVFMVSNNIYEKYMESPAVYDRIFQKRLDKRRRIKSRTQKTTKIMETANQYVEKINRFNAQVNDRSISKKLSKIEATVSVIFHEIDANPEQIDSFGIFLHYYLTTLEKLLDAYSSIGKKQYSDRSHIMAQKEIQKAIVKIVPAFESILEKLYEEQAMGISNNIGTQQTYP